MNVNLFAIMAQKSKNALDGESKLSLLLLWTVLYYKIVPLKWLKSYVFYFPEYLNLYLTCGIIQYAEN